MTEDTEWYKKLKNEEWKELWLVGYYERTGSMLAEIIKTVLNDPKLRLSAAQKLLANAMIIDEIKNMVQTNK